MEVLGPELVLSAWAYPDGWAAVSLARSAGLPVVAAAVGGIPEMVRSGREGVLVRPDNPNELASALVRLLMDSDTRVRMAAAAKRRAEEFSVRVMTQSLHKTYLELAAGGSS